MLRVIKSFSNVRQPVDPFSLINLLVQKDLTKICAYKRFCSENINGSGDKNEKKKKQIIPRITLISDGDKIEITTLDEAQKLSHRRNLKLVKIVDLDLKTQRPIYKLLSGTEYFAEELQQRENKKSKKEYIKGESESLFFLPKQTYNKYSAIFFFRTTFS